MPDLNNNSVAIIDDEPGIVQTYKLLFGRHQIPVAFVAGNGFDGLDRFRTANPRPRVIILDYKMPYMSGLEVLSGIFEVEPDTKSS